MSVSNGRFCVRFSGTVPDKLKKTEIFYKDSSQQTIRNIWKSHYDTIPPKDIDLIVGDHSRYSLNDEGDFRAFMAIAEDHYRLLPAKPLHVTIIASSEFVKPISPPLSFPSPPPRIENDVNENHAEHQFKIHPINDVTQQGHEQEMPEDLSVRKDFCQTSGQEKSFQASNFSLLRPDSNKSQIQAKTSFNSKPFLPDINAAAAFVSSIQQQRLLQSSPNAPYLLQYIRNNIERASALRMANTYPSASKATNTFALPLTMNELKYYQGTMNSTLPSCQSNPEAKPKRKRKTNTSAILNGTNENVAKRMRSSSELSNIEFHVLQAEAFHELSHDDKQSHNSAHRSHWKHLFHVKNIFPEFIEKNKTSKYDEWSSEARDIYAITKPDCYKWAFLTISKQGDNLCRRIKKRVQEMKRLPDHERPPWCPKDRVLAMAMEKADERLKQLERIQETRRIKNGFGTEKKSCEDEVSKKASAHAHFSTNQQNPLAQIPNFCNSTLSGSRANTECMPLSNVSGSNMPNPRSSSNGIGFAARNFHLFRQQIKQHRLAVSFATKEKTTSGGNSASEDQSFNLVSTGHDFPFNFHNAMDVVNNINFSNYPDDPGKELPASRLKTVSKNVKEETQQPKFVLSSNSMLNFPSLSTSDSQEIYTVVKQDDATFKSERMEQYESSTKIPPITSPSADDK